MANKKNIKIKDERQLPDELIETIESTIGYTFNHRDLLVQAFTKDSYGLERGCQSNQVLEFYGDEVLDFFVSKIILDRYGFIELKDDGTYEYQTMNHLTEKDLTTMKIKLVDNDHLAHIMDKWGWHKYIFMGHGDELKEENEKTKVKADLFESILGAIMVDSKFDKDLLENSVNVMLGLDFSLMNDLIAEDNYVELVQVWSQKRYNKLPDYVQDNTQVGLIQEFHCSLMINDFTATGTGRNKKEARNACAKMAYEYIVSHHLDRTFKDDCPSEDQLTLDNAINALQEFSQKGWCSNPEYEEALEAEYSTLGNPLWTCSCSVNSFGITHTTEASSKKDAKKYAAYLCLCDIMGYRDRYMFDNSINVNEIL